MKFTLGWLKDHLATDADLDTIAATCTHIGLEVEAVHDRAAELRDFVVGHVVECGQHPNADKLSLCTVDDGTDHWQVVCGAPNVYQGLKGVFARPGTVIPANGEALGRARIRGVESRGMLCSETELRLGDDAGGIIDLPGDPEPGQPVAPLLGVDDPVIELELTPNRPDALGVRGVARDLAAAGLGSLKPLKTDPVPGEEPSPVSVNLDFPAGAADACPLFVGRHVRGVTNGESPQWLRDRLKAIGLRPISALVDITNYITHDLARPLHVFDAGTLTGDGLTARLARDGETLEALDGRTYTLDGGMTVIADDAGPQGLAGVIGGAATGCTETTTDVVIESALFDPVRTAATGRRLGIPSDARHRFERGVDPLSARWGMEVATRLIVEICGGTPSETVVAGGEPAWERPFVLRPERVGTFGGVDIPRADVEAKLDALGCTMAEHPEGLHVTPPSWRPDLGAEQDGIEEVVRLHGYDSIPAVSLPTDHAVPRAVLTTGQRRAAWVRRCLAGRGLLEAVTWSFMDSRHAALFGGVPDSLYLANPIASDLDVLRPSVLPNLLLAAGRNADRGLGDSALFEVGAIYNGTRPADQERVAAGLRPGHTGPRHWLAESRPADVFDAKADVLAALREAEAPVDNLQAVAAAPEWYHPGRSGVLKLGRTVVAHFGEIHPRVLKRLDIQGPAAAFELFLDALPPRKRKGTTRPALTLSPYQPVTRDFAFVVPEDTRADDLVRAARGADKSLISDVQVFDVYQGKNVAEGHKSIAIAVTLQPMETTLTDEQIDAVGDRVIQAVNKATGGELRK